jgi:hypothetical protein
VDAIVALATASARATVCRSCGAGNTSDSRFCRSCGAPAAHESLPAELEVMRLNAGARAAHQEHFTGVLIILLNLAVALPLILLTGRPKAIRVGFIILAIGQILGWLTLLYGMLRLHRTLNPRRGASREPFAADLPRAVAGAQGTSALPPASANTWAASVTEGTTELLGAPPKKEPAAEPVRRARENTDPL